MSYKHGIYVTEAETDLLTMSQQAAGVTVVVGTAPTACAEPVLCYTPNEAATKLGYSTDTATFTLCEAMDVLYGQYNVAPVVFINAYKAGASSDTTITNVAGYTDTSTGAATGLDLIEEIYPRFGLTVGQIIAPGFSQYPTVGAKMAAKAENINGHFSAMAIVDLDTTISPTLDAIRAAKTTAGYSSAHMAVCYPMVSYGGSKQHLSTHVAGLLCKLSASDGDIPYRSPSNRELYIDGMIKEDGSSCYFGQSLANDLNGEGIVTVLRQDGWRCWGNRTAAATSQDPKDTWIAVRRMFDYVKAALVLNFRSKLDEPILRRNIESVVNSVNVYLNGLVSKGALLGGRVVYADEDNTEADIMDGRLNFRCYITPPTPAREINFTLQYDRSYLTTVLEG